MKKLIHIFSLITFLFFSSSSLAGYWTGVGCIQVPNTPSALGYTQESTSGTVSCPENTVYWLIWNGVDSPDCSDSQVASPSIGACEEVCEYGSLSPECSTDCPALEYTYYSNGVLRSGTQSGGTVGFGQSCPQPSFPPGYNSGCVGSPGTCGDFVGATPENVPVTVEETTTTETQNGDGSSTSTETTTTSTTGGPGQTSVIESGTGQTGTDGLTSNGDSVDSSSINPQGDGADLSDSQINLGDSTYQLCNNGGIANSSTGCDYTSNNCGPGQVDSVYGCYDIPQYEDPGPVDPAQTTETNQGAPVDNGDGSSTTTSTTTTTSSPGSGTGEGEGEGEVNRVGSPSNNCDSPPVCSGDAIDCAILVEEWKNSCNAYELSTPATDCLEPPTCEGDPIECSIFLQDWDQYCSDQVSTLAMATDADTEFTEQGFLDLDNLAPGELFDEIAEESDEKDIQSELGEFFSYTPTTGTCPPPETANLGKFGTVEFSYQLFCDLATYIYYVAILGAYFVGGNIVLRSFTS